MVTLTKTKQPLFLRQWFCYCINSICYCEWDSISFMENQAEPTHIPNRLLPGFFIVVDALMLNSAKKFISWELKGRIGYFFRGWSKSNDLNSSTIRKHVCNRGLWACIHQAAIRKYAIQCISHLRSCQNLDNIAH